MFSAAEVDHTFNSDTAPRFTWKCTDKPASQQGLTVITVLSYTQTNHSGVKMTAAKQIGVKMPQEALVGLYNSIFHNTEMNKPMLSCLFLPHI